MAAKRLGSALGNVEGTSNQLLRVKTDESGFEFVNPASIPAYTLSNITTDRIIDGTTTTIDEIARVLGTLIQDLTDAGLTGAGGVSTFTWSTSEQVWPFEKASNGNTIYAKEISIASWSSQVYSIAHNISNLNKIHRLDGQTKRTDGYYLNIPNSSTAGGTGELEVYNTTTTSTIAAGNAFWPYVQNQPAVLRILYTKTS
jgi:hypothetical protein